MAKHRRSQSCWRRARPSRRGRARGRCGAASRGRASRPRSAARAARAGPPAAAPRPRRPCSPRASPGARRRGRARREAQAARAGGAGARSLLRRARLPPPRGLASRARWYTGSTSRHARRAARPEAAPRRRGRFRPREEGRSSGCERIRDSAHAGPRARRGALGGDHRAHPNERRGRRRHVGRSRAVGPPQARLRDRPQAGRRVPPPALHRDAGDARRDLARAQDHGRRHAPPRGAARQGRAHEGSCADCGHRVHSRR